MKRLLLISTLFLPAIAMSEDISFDLPSGFAKAFEDGDSSFFIQEWVPTGESVDNWSQMLTLTVLEKANVDPIKFFDLMADEWGESCPDYGAMLLHHGQENNYPIAVWLLTCPENYMTGKPEVTYVKGISGNENFYTVQIAHAVRVDEVDDSTVNVSMGFLKQVAVCDNGRSEAHPC